MRNLSLSVRVHPEFRDAIMGRVPPGISVAYVAGAADLIDLSADASGFAHAAGMLLDAIAAETAVDLESFDVVAPNRLAAETAACVFCDDAFGRASLSWDAADPLTLSLPAEPWFLGELATAVAALLAAFLPVDPFPPIPEPSAEVI